MGEPCVTSPAFQAGKNLSPRKETLVLHRQITACGFATHECRALDLTFVDEAVARLGRGGDAVIPILQAIQTHYRYVPREAIERVCQLTEITPAAIVGVSTFYNQFRHRPVGRHLIHVCHGTACHVKGSELIQDAFQRRLKIADGERHRPGRAVYDREGGLPGLLHAGPRGADRRNHLRAAFLRHGRRGDRRFPRQQQGRGPTERKRAVAPPRQQLGEIRVGLGSCCVAQGSGQVYPGHRGRPGPERRGGRGQTGRLRRHVPPNAAGGTDSAEGQFAETVLESPCRRRGGNRPAALQAAGYSAADQPHRGPLAR